MSRRALSLATLLCCLCPPLHAAFLYRCNDSQGHVSFNQHGCSPGSEMQTQSPETPNLLDSQPTQSKSRTGPDSIRDKKQAKKGGEIVVVGEREAICGNLLTPQERRQAIIRGQVRNGMTRADVESALGKPERISGLNGQLRYHYGSRKRESRQVTFDEAGCVKGRR